MRCSNPNPRELPAAKRDIEKTRFEPGDTGWLFIPCMLPARQSSSDLCSGICESPNLGLRQCFCATHPVSPVTHRWRLPLSIAQHYDLCTSTYGVDPPNVADATKLVQCRLDVIQGRRIV